MKITDIKASLIEIPAQQQFEYIWMPGARSQSIKFTLVRVFTDEGVVGIGASHEGRDVEGIAAIRSWVAPYLIGRDPTQLEPLGEILTFARPFGPVPWLVSQALCDIVGKAANLPLYRLWGGSRDRIPAYAAPCKPRSPDEWAAIAQRLRDMGFQALKCRLHNARLADDIAIIEAVRNAVGASMEIMVDANQAVLLNSPRPHPRWDYRRALETARELERLGVYYLEEPLYLYDFDGIARLTAETSIYIAGGEWNVGLHEFKWMLDKGAYDIYQPDVTQTTGPWETLQVGLLAHAHRKLCIPHTWGNGIGLAGNLQVALALPNCPYFEYPFDPEVYPVSHNQGMLTEPLVIDAEGYVRATAKPGLGVELNEDVIERYTVATTATI